MSDRTHIKWTRVYGDGYDLSGYSRSIGPLIVSYSQVGEPAVSDALHGFLPGQAVINPGTLNAVMDNTSNGLHDKFNAANELVTVMVAIGMRAAPAAGDAVFVGDFEMMNYLATGEEDVVVTAEFAGSSRATTLLYDKPWGVLLHPKGAETAVNTGTSDHDYGAQTLFGGYMCYHLFTSDGTVTIKVQDSSVDANPNFGDLVSSGVIDASATPAAAIVALGKAATVERYTRWQIVLGTATTATFALSFHRAIR